MDSIWESKKLATGDFVVEEPKKKKKTIWSQSRCKNTH